MNTNLFIFFFFIIFIPEIVIIFVNFFLIFV